MYYRQMNEDFRETVKEIEANPACRKMTLANYLSLPLARIAAYIDKLKKLEEFTHDRARFLVRKQWRLLSKVTMIRSRKLNPYFIEKCCCKSVFLLKIYIGTRTFNPYSAGIDFSRQNLTSIDVIF